MSEDNQVVESFLKEICDLFPEVSVAIDKRIDSLGYGAEDFMYTEKMEAFSQFTTNAIKRFDERTVRAHFEYVSNKLSKASKVEAEYIDVYYVESLMWDIKDKKVKKWGWSLFPNNLKALYREVWGEPDF